MDLTAVISTAGTIYGSAQNGDTGGTIDAGITALGGDTSVGNTGMSYGDLINSGISLVNEVNSGSGGVSGSTQVDFGAGVTGWIPEDYEAPAGYDGNVALGVGTAIGTAVGGWAAPIGAAIGWLVDSVIGIFDNSSVDGKDIKADLVGHAERILKAGVARAGGESKIDWSNPAWIQQYGAGGYDKAHKARVNNEYHKGRMKTGRSKEYAEIVHKFLWDLEGQFYDLAVTPEKFVWTKKNGTGTQTGTGKTSIGNIPSGPITVTVPSSNNQGSGSGSLLGVGIAAFVAKKLLF